MDIIQIQNNNGRHISLSMQPPPCPSPCAAASPPPVCPGAAWRREKDTSDLSIFPQVIILTCLVSPAGGGPGLLPGGRSCQTPSQGWTGRPANLLEQGRASNQWDLWGVICTADSVMECQGGCVDFNSFFREGFRYLF